MIGTWVITYMNEAWKMFVKFATRNMIHRLYFVQQDMAPRAQKCEIPGIDKPRSVDAVGIN
jgi:hypothetical protein